MFPFDNIIMCYFCSQIPVILHKEPERDPSGNPVYEPDGKQKYRCGFKIGGGIDQDPIKSPQGYPDKVLKKTSWPQMKSTLNSLSPGGCGYEVKCAVFSCIVVIPFMIWWAFPQLFSLKVNGTGP